MFLGRNRSAIDNLRIQIKASRLRKEKICMLHVRKCTRQLSMDVIERVFSELELFKGCSERDANDNKRGARASSDIDNRFNVRVFIKLQS